MHVILTILLYAFGSQQVFVVQEDHQSLESCRAAGDMIVNNVHAKASKDFVHSIKVLSATCTTK